VKDEGPNVGARARARLLRLARERGDDFQLVLLRYAHERLLYRLAASRHAGQFVLKGAALFTVWTGHPHRATRDLDLLAFGDPAEDRIRAVFTELAGMKVEDDGVAFDPSSIDVGPIREDQEYGGVRVRVEARITSAVVRLQIDIGFGDVITPGAAEIEFPALLDFPAPRLRAYPRETVVAEKLEAMVTLGLANSRMKDFHDVATLSRLFAFDGALLVRAIRATFARRGTPLPDWPPVALTPAFGEDPGKRTQWAGFVRKSAVPDAGSLTTTIAAVIAFVERPLTVSASGDPWVATWPARGPWQE
jgi:hypothetical protein